MNSTDSSTAEENLRVIRGLMERATIYRTISIPAAAFAGTLAVVVGVCMAYFKPPNIPFVVVWLGVLLISASANFYFLWRGSQGRGEKFFSAGMLLALRCTAPILLLSGVITLMFINMRDTGSIIMAIIWIIAYGLLLLSTQAFAPVSLVRLGWAFLITGIAIPVGIFFLRNFLPDIGPPHFSYLLMAATFGVYHLIYASVGFATKSKA